MKYLTIILIAFLFTGCTVFHEKPLPPSEATTVALTVQWVDSEADLPRHIREYRADKKGVSIWFDVDGKRYCTIYAIKPYNVDDFKHLNTLGHELLHCTDGNYHGRVRDKNGAEIMEEMRQR